MIGALDSSMRSRRSHAASRALNSYVYYCARLNHCAPLPFCYMGLQQKRRSHHPKFSKGLSFFPKSIVMSQSFRARQLLQTSVIPNQPIETRRGHRFFLPALALTGSFGYFSFGPMVLLIALITCIVIFDLIKRIDQGLPLVQIIAFVAILQWLIGPWLTYTLDLSFSTYYMRVPSDIYFTYAIPGTSAFVAGLIGFGSCAHQKVLILTTDRSRFVETGFVTAFAGLVGTLGTIVLAGSTVAFFFSLLSQFLYISALYFIFSSHRLRWAFALLAVTPLFINVVRSAMFHDMILWFGVLFCYIYASKKRSLLLSSVALVSASIFVFTIQGVKGSYRDKVWNLEDSSLIDEVTSFWSDSGNLISDTTLSNGIIRMNQGWIVAAVMDFVPSREPYGYGDTIKEGLISALLPRFILKDKIEAGGRLNFRRFTGIPIADNTSMGISLLGESYANVGPRVGIVGMFIFGLCLSIWNNFCLSFASTKQDFYFWLPFIFCQAIKAETDFVTILNYVVKASVVGFSVFWLIHTLILKKPRVPRAGRLHVSLNRTGSSLVGVSQSSFKSDGSNS